MKNKVFLRIFAFFFSLVLLVSCFVIAPSADTYDDNLNHYWLYFKHSQAEENLPDDSYSLTIDFESPFYQKCTFIYYRLNGQNLFTSRTFKSLRITMQSFLDIDPDTEENLGGFTTFTVAFDPKDYDNNPADMPILRFRYEWDNESYYGLSIFGENLHENYSSVQFPWLESYGNYNLQLWLDSNYITNFSTNGSFNGVDQLSSIFRYSLISRAKTYTDGYISGNDFGYEQGYGDGYDQGSIDGIQQGITEGYNSGYDNGFQDGLDDGYSVGFDDGRMDGIEEGYRDGYDDAKAVYDTTEAWQDMKSLIFAIFDAPFYVISYSLDFDLFGINVAGTLIALISTALIVWLLKIIIVKFF